MQHKAEQGNEIALVVLRSRRDLVEPEIIAQAKDWSVHGNSSVKIDYLQKERAVLEHEGLAAKAKRRLQAILRMEQVVSVSGKSSVTSRVDKNGAVIFALPSGGAIRDSGNRLSFSANNKEAETLALQYARKSGVKESTLRGMKSFVIPQLSAKKEWNGSSTSSIRVFCVELENVLS
ncbi:hypothetical protein V6C16_02120 [Desulfovibrio sp. 1188_IL3213]|uniref:hypothetical protein n=1 Tax=Desulfovibrio sp. 1188_IL3213 TaxID=3084052 RepID=UPI002FDA1594